MTERPSTNLAPSDDASATTPAPDEGRGRPRVRGLQRRLWAAFLAVALMSAVTAGVARLEIGRLDALRSDQLGRQVPHLLALEKVAVDAKAVANDERGFLMTADPQFTTEIDGRLTKIDANLKAAADSADDDAQRARVATASAGIATWVKAIRAEFAQAATDPQGARAKALGDNRALRKSYEDALTKAVDGATNSIQHDTTFADVVGRSGALVLTLAVFAILGGIVVAYRLTHRLARSVGTQLHGLSALAGGDLTARVPVEGRDEFAAMATSFNEAAEGLAGTLGAVTSTAGRVTQAASELLDGARGAVQDARSSRAAGDDADQGARGVADGVASVAAGTEEMTASIGHIATNAQDAARVAADAVVAAHAATATVGRLGDSTQAIGDVVKAITAIAEQTNLLALNATIEAARAGEAGKGFAVVANEVKDLAQETAKATEDISHRVEQVQADTSAAVAAIEGIADVISQIHDTQNAIAGAVDEQTATTTEMSRSVSGVSDGAAAIAARLEAISRAAQVAEERGRQTEVTSQRLLAEAEDLLAAAGRFRR